jgi:8-oxo-dGTP diphosphatase
MCSGSLYAQDNVSNYNESEAIMVTQRPKVGVGVLIMDGSFVLLGKRKNAHGHDMWAPPGGHLEYGESWHECAHREVLEETGLQLSNSEFFAVTNDVFDEQKHYVTIFMKADYPGGPVQNLEPDKCYEWRWFEIDQLPDNLFLPLRNLLNEREISAIVNCNISMHTTPHQTFAHQDE